MDKLPPLPPVQPKPLKPTESISVNYTPPPNPNLNVTYDDVMQTATVLIEIGKKIKEKEDEKK